jgi:3-oxoacyl-[acyl-carrier protein] reductase
VINLAGGGVGGPGVASRLSAYTAAKAGVLTLTETLAAELADANIQVNAIAPCAIATGFTDPLLASGPERAGDDLYAQTVHQREHPDSLEQFGALLLHLAQPGAGGVTGRTVSARWDSIEQLTEAAPHLATSSRYRMRRIDEALYAERVEL